MTGLRSLASTGVPALALAVLLVAYVLLSPGPARVPFARRRPGVAAPPHPLRRVADAATKVVDRMLPKRSSTAPGLLAQAGVTMRHQDLAILVAVAGLVAGVVGVVLGGPLLGLCFAALMPLAAKVALGAKAARRRSAFADQLDDTLQLLASSLRAGHSLLQALASVSREAEEPTSEEFSRIINETRVGRELGDALEETARRMGNQDFVWIAQAIAINREVGGNLAEVLDGVAGTIRERNQIRRQVKALAAEGKLSAYILMALPFGITAFLAVANPGYIGRFTESLLGYVLIATCLVLLTVGGLWLRKVVNFRF
jgi:tight adherence protein B